MVLTDKLLEDCETDESFLHVWNTGGKDFIKAIRETWDIICAKTKKLE